MSWSSPMCCSCTHARRDRQSRLRYTACVQWILQHEQAWRNSQMFSLCSTSSTQSNQLVSNPIVKHWDKRGGIVLSASMLAGVDGWMDGWINYLMDGWMHSGRKEVYAGDMDTTHLPRWSNRKWWYCQSRARREPKGDPDAIRCTWLAPSDSSSSSWSRI